MYYLLYNYQSTQPFISIMLITATCFDSTESSSGYLRSLKWRCTFGIPKVYINRYQTDVVYVSKYKILATLCA